MKGIWSIPVLTSILILGLIGISANVNAEPGNTTIEIVDTGNGFKPIFHDPDGIRSFTLIIESEEGVPTEFFSGVLSCPPNNSGIFEIEIFVPNNLISIQATVTDCQAEPDVTVWEIAADGSSVNCIEGSCLPVDSDGDGFDETVDCDDTNPLTFPGAAEICDGEDNDCDGTIDEDFVDLGSLCSVGVGACERSGVIVCALSGGSTVCSVEAGPPSPEVCTDEIDNDCDGLTDIADPVCQSPEVCDGADNDGDGLIDEGFDLGQACSVGVGACENSGVTVCTADGLGTECNADVGTPTPELCDTIDNDCDGTIDNDVDETDPDLGASCSLPFEVGECRNGFNICTEEGLVCEGQSPTEETCDGLDNDCDGSTDENDTGGSVCTIPVTIDIKPGSDENPINCKSKGNTPIAILSDEPFDATTIETEILSLSLVGSEPIPVTITHNLPHVGDVDGDGDLDVLVHINTADICSLFVQVQRDDVATIILDSQLPDGTPIEGSDEVVVVGSKVKDVVR